MEGDGQYKDNREVDVKPFLQFFVYSPIFSDRGYGVPDTEHAAHLPGTEFVRYRGEAVGDHENDAN